MILLLLDFILWDMGKIAKRNKDKCVLKVVEGNLRENFLIFGVLSGIFE